MIINIGICDDEITYHEKIKNMCVSYFQEKSMTTSFHYFTNSCELLSYKDTLDILFLDIEMSGLSGIDILPSLNNMHNIFNIVFVTSYDEYIYDSFSYKTVGFITKPIDISRLYKYMDMIMDQHFLASVITFPTGITGNKKLVFANDITYLEGYGNYCKVHLSGDEDYFLTNNVLSYWETVLSEFDFIRIHKSYIVNLRKIVRLDNSNTLTLSPNIKLQIGRKYVENTKNAHDIFCLSKLRRIHNANK